MEQLILKISHREQSTCEEELKKLQLGDTDWMVAVILNNQPPENLFHFSNAKLNSKYIKYIKYIKYRKYKT